MKQQILVLSLFVSLITVISPGCAPGFAQYMGNNGGGPQAPPSTPPVKIQEWFAKYDNIRRAAQMNPQERARSDAMMAKGLSIFVPGEEKTEMQAFLRKLIQKNMTAAAELKQLPLYPESEQLHREYYQYFVEAAQVFNDYISVQDNPLAVDSQGRSIAANLLGRKQNLEMLDQQDKALDAQLRQQFHIAPYHYP